MTTPSPPNRPPSTSVERGSLLRELEEEFHQTERSWHVLSREATWLALEQAVDGAFEECRQKNSQEGHLEGAIRQSELRGAIRRRFVELIVRRARKVKGATRRSLVVELERSKNLALKKRNAARRELEDLQAATRRLKESLARPKDDVLLPEEERSLDRELRAKIEELHRRRLATGSGLAFDPESVEELTAFVRDQRERALSLGLAQDRDAMAILERRISKLTGTLERAEHALATLARKTGDGTTVQELFRDLQGLALEEPLDGAKAEMLRVLFEENLEFRREIAG